MILILSHAGDVHVEAVVPHLDRLRVPYRLNDPGQAPLERFEGIAVTRGRYAARLERASGGDLNLDRVTAVWYRRPTDLLSHDARQVHDEQRFITANRREVVDGIWNQMRCAWLPAQPHVEGRASNKAYHLSVAADMGFRIPDTRITATPAMLPEMFSRHEGSVVLKPPMPYFNRTHNEQHTFTRAVRRRELRGLLGLRHAPVILQERIPKRCDVRVTVVGNEVFAAAIHSQERATTSVDFRHDIFRLRHTVHALPAVEVRRCRALVRRLGLCFGAIDLVQTPSGEHVFLEINPNGQWLWIERATGLPIADAVARLLAKAHATGR